MAHGVYSVFIANVKLCLQLSF